MPAPLTPAALRYWRLSHSAAKRNGAGRPCGGWSQARAAQHLGVSLRTYHAWERGRRPVPRLAALAIANDLHRATA